MGCRSRCTGRSPGGTPTLAGSQSGAGPRPGRAGGVPAWLHVGSSIQGRRWRSSTLVGPTTRSITRSRPSASSARRHRHALLGEPPHDAELVLGPVVDAVAPQHGAVALVVHVGGSSTRPGGPARSPRHHRSRRTADSPAVSPDQRQQVTGVFDRATETYDNVGVDLFQPVADLLLTELAPQPGGERGLDVGWRSWARCCSRWPPRLDQPGHAVGIDLAPRMVAATAAEVPRAAGLEVDVRVDDAHEGGLDEAPFDVIASSLVLFFLPDPGRRAHHVARPAGARGPHRHLHVRRPLTGVARGRRGARAVPGPADGRPSHPALRQPVRVRRRCRGPVPRRRLRQRSAPSRPPCRCASRTRTSGTPGPGRSGSGACGNPSPRSTTPPSGPPPTSGSTDCRDDEGPRLRPGHPPHPRRRASPRRQAVAGSVRNEYRRRCGTPPRRCSRRDHGRTRRSSRGGTRARAAAGGAPRSRLPPRHGRRPGPPRCRRPRIRCAPTEALAGGPRARSRSRASRPRRSPPRRRSP